MTLSLLVRDVMVRSVAFVAIPGNRDDVLKTLQDRKVSGLPVVKKGEVVGMITRTDLLRNPEEDQTALLMTRDPIVISPEKSIVEASQLLIQHGIRRLPVVEGKDLVGIITVADIIRVAADMNIAESIEPYLETETAVLLERDALACSRIDYGVRGSGRTLVVYGIKPQRRESARRTNERRRLFAQKKYAIFFKCW